MSENVKCPECGSGPLMSNGRFIQFDCHSQKYTDGSGDFGRAKACIIIASLKAELEKANEKNRALEAENVPLKIAQSYVESMATSRPISLSHKAVQNFAEKIMSIYRDEKIKRGKMK